MRGRASSSSREERGRPEQHTRQAAGGQAVKQALAHVQNIKAFNRGGGRKEPRRINILARPPINK